MKARIMAELPCIVENEIAASEPDGVFYVTFMSWSFQIFFHRAEMTKNVEFLPSFDWCLNSSIGS